MKKILIGIFAVIFISITFLQYSENLKLRREPPSNEWAKEVLIASGNITDYPQLIKYNDYYIVCYTDGTAINILAVDKLGNKLSEKSFSGEGDKARNPHVVTDGQDINISWIATENNVSNVYSLVLSKEFDIKQKGKIDDIKDLKQSGNNLLIIGFSDRIKIIDFKAGKSSEFPVISSSLICGTMSGDKNVVAFLNGDNNFFYLLVKDGIPTEPKEVGVLSGTTRKQFYNAAVAVEGNKGYLMAEYRYQSMFGGSQIMEFALDGSGYNSRETADKDRAITIFNTVSFTAIDESKKGIKFIAGGYRPLGKKESYEDVLELEVSNGIISKSTPMSRTRALSGFPSGYGDTAVFSDVVDYNYSNLYMTSYREDFKTANNTNRRNEYVLAFVDTCQGILYTFVYMVAFGALWILPSFCSASILSLLEYRFNDKHRKGLFLFAYFIAFLFKTYFIYTIIYKKLRYFLPGYLTASIGLGVGLVISIVCCIYCYRKYIANLQRNTIAANFSAMFILDSWFTLFLFIPFIK